jgi:hypothetical protein
VGSPAKAREDNRVLPTGKKVGIAFASARAKPLLCFGKKTAEQSEVNMADNSMQKDWSELCVAVTTESDSTKLSSLVRELIEALERGERSWRHHAIRMPDAIVTNRNAA